VYCRGEELGEIWWQGRQWAVTKYGIECRDGCYFIDKDRLAEKLPLSDVPEWPWHVSQKIWADIADFCTCFLVAISLHGCRIEPKLLRKAVEMALVETGR
jgi:hypothetical protein